MADTDSDRIHRGVWLAQHGADEEAKLRRLADLAETAAEAIQEINAHHGHGADMAWSVRDLDDEARGLRQEADKIWD